MLLYSDHSRASRHPALWLDTFALAFRVAKRSEASDPEHRPNLASTKLNRQ